MPFDLPDCANFSGFIQFGLSIETLFDLSGLSAGLSDGLSDLSDGLSDLSAGLSDGLSAGLSDGLSAGLFGLRANCAWA